ncbi:urease accessory protein UreD [Pseudophaeobacter sp.]|uniref:urease accessory protein UreD n=1 Tax=Pseudophaeobacter sp. TaxID=1971739 RepID=UPI003296E249
MTLPPEETSITLTTDISQQTAQEVQPAQPRARGRIKLSVKQTTRGSALRGLRQSGSFRCLFPRPKITGLEAVLVNTAGGITGGDDMRIAAEVGAGASLTLTTQTSERAYRAQPGETGQLQTKLTVAEGGHVNWLPQETILFQGCALSRRLDLDLAPDATALLVEPLVFGRLAMGETVTQGLFHDRILLRRNGQELYRDALRFEGDMQAQLDRPHVAAGARALVSLIYVAPDAAGQLSPLRAMLPDQAGASLIGADLLVLRILAADAHDLRQSLLPVLNHLTHNTLPRCWMI